MNESNFRIGVLGLTHDHVWENLHHLSETPQGTLVGAADPHAELQERFQRDFGSPAYADAAALLDAEPLDAVYVFSDNAASVELGVEAARRGLHILLEKPMAANLAGADRLLAAVRAAEVRLMVNWPFAWWPPLQEAIRLAQSGRIGELWQVKYRAGHAGPREVGCSTFFSDWLADPVRNGAGALIDYCCYGAALSRVLLGPPSRVVGAAQRLRKEEITVEDNAVLVLSYPRAMALAEGSWTQVDKLTAYRTVIYGSEGTLYVEPRQDGRLLLADRRESNGAEIDIPRPAPPWQNATHHFLSRLETGEPFFELTADRVARDVQEILEAGLLSVARGGEVSLPLR